jgi:colicin import membrane protein
MSVTSQRLEFAPPATPGLLRAFGLAILAHGLLLAALTLSVQWHRDAQVLSAEAELWAAVPQAAAPKLVEVPPPPPPPPPKLPVQPKLIEPPQPAKVDINLAKEKQRLEKQKQAELDRLEKLKVEQRKQAELDKQKALEKKKTEQEDKQREVLRQQNLQRMAGIAGATGKPTATGTALTAAAPSASYAGRIRARIKPNIVFTESLVGNPAANVEVRTSPDGTIVGRKLLKSSGNSAWDEAVLKAIDKTAVLPRDTDGQMPPLFEISFTPRE